MKRMAAFIGLCGALALVSGCAVDADEGDREEEEGEDTDSSEEGYVMMEEGPIGEAGSTCSSYAERSYCSSGLFYNSVSYICTHTSGEQWTETRLFGGYATAGCSAS
jgi:hypothetical protein